MAGPLADWQIRERMTLPDGDPKRLSITPFAEATKEPGKISHGLSSYGYDLRLSNQFARYAKSTVSVHRGDQVITEEEAIDPKTAAERMWDLTANSLVLPPNGFILGMSVERFVIPEDVIAIVTTKSTYARVGICLNMTPLESGWQGTVTIEIANLSQLPVRIHPGEGIGQVIFYEGSAPCLVPYNKKPHAMYQNQTGVTAARV